MEGAFPGEPGALPVYTQGMPAFLCRVENSPPGKEKQMEFMISGKSAPESFWNVESDACVFAYFFQPFMLPCLFNVSAASIAKEPVDLERWNPQLTKALKIQWLSIHSVAEGLEILDRFLLQLVSENKRNVEIIRYATDQIMYQTGTEILTELQRELNITERTFQRLFKKFVGISPGQYRRICQFQGSFSQVKSGGFDQLSDVAYDNGFSDQSHFIRSFREFTRVTPNHYLRFGLGEKKS